MCPDTPILFMNHYWDGVRDDPKWPATEPMYLMPNIEMYELEASHYRKADVIICKPVVCDKYLRKRLAQEGNPTNVQVIYSRHTSSNLASYARVQLGDNAIVPKNFSDPKFVHVVGSSIFKATGKVLDCWLSRPDFPLIDIYIVEVFYNGAYKNRYDKRIQASRNIKVHPGPLDSVALGKIVAEAAFFMCPSIQEGYGHNLNQARAAGGLAMTTDIPPMNELITPKSGVAFHTKALSSPNQFLGGTSNHADGLRNVTGFVAGFNGNDICKAVDSILHHMTPKEREKRAERAKQQYYYDTVLCREDEGAPRLGATAAHVHASRDGTATAAQEQLEIHGQAWQRARLTNRNLAQDRFLKLAKATSFFNIYYNRSALPHNAGQQV